MAPAVCVDDTWQVWRSPTNLSHNGKFWNCVHSFLLVTVNRHLTLNQYCLLLLAIKDFANIHFSSFAYWCEIKGLQLLLFELGCVVWQKHMFWMLDIGKHCIRVIGDQFSTVSLWWLTLFLFLAVIILASSYLHSSVISVVESECRWEKKWQQRNLDWWSLHFLD